MADKASSAEKIGIASGNPNLIDQLIEDKGGQTKVADVAKEVIESTSDNTKVIPPNNN